MSRPNPPIFANVAAASICSTISWRSCVDKANEAAKATSHKLKKCGEQPSLFNVCGSGVWCLGVQRHNGKSRQVLLLQQSSLLQCNAIILPPLLATCEANLTFMS